MNMSRPQETAHSLAVKLDKLGTSTVEEVAQFADRANYGPYAPTFSEATREQAVTTLLDLLNSEESKYGYYSLFEGSDYLEARWTPKMLGGRFEYGTAVLRLGEGRFACIPWRREND